MNKRPFFGFIGILCFLVSVLLTSCGSLWTVQNNASISMSLNLSSLSYKGGNSDIEGTTPKTISSGVREIDDDSAFIEGDRVTVSLLYTSDDKSLATQVFFIDDADDIANLNVQFGNIEQNIEIYAKVVVERNSSSTWTPVFESRSDNVVIQKGVNELATYANVIFVAHEKGADKNTSNGAGITASNPMYRLNDAFELIEKTQSFYTDATIYLVHPIDVYNDDTGLGVQASDGGRLIDFSHLTIKRVTSDNSFFVIENGNSLTLERATLKGDENAKAPLISVSGDGSTLTLKNETSLQDNINTYFSDDDDDDDIEQSTAGVNVLDGAKLIIENSAIINNKAVIPFAVAGVNLGENAILELQGGNVFISGNVTDDLLGSNVHYNLPIDPEAITKKTFPVQVTGALSDESKIGLSPKTVGADTFVVAMSNGGTIAQSNFSMDDGSSVIINDDGHLSFIPPKYIFIGGSTSSDNNDGLTENTPVKTFAKAQELYNAGDTIEVVGTIEVSGTEIWKEEEGQQINLVFKYDDGTGNPITPDFTLVHVTSTGELTLDNVDISPPGGGLASDALVTVEGKLVLKGNVEIYGNDFTEDSYNDPNAVFKKGSVELKNAGTLELHDGHIRLGHGIRYTLPQGGQSSPISIEGTLKQNEDGQSSDIWLLFDTPPTIGNVLVEKGENGTVDVDAFYVRLLGKLLEEGDIQTGKELNQNGDLVYLELQDSVVIDSVEGNDTNYGGSNDPVKTFTRAMQLVKTGYSTQAYHGNTSDTPGIVYARSTIAVEGHENWNPSHGVTVRREDGFTGTLIAVNNGGKLTVSNSGSLFIEGNTDAETPLLAINGDGSDSSGLVEFLNGNQVMLRNNINTVGVGAIFVNGGKLTLEENGYFVSDPASTVNNNVSTSVDGIEPVGAIVIENKGTVILNGANITENTGGAIHIGEMGTLVLSGKTQVIGNGASAQNISYDMPIAEGYGIYIGGKLTSETDKVIGITPNGSQDWGAPIVKKLVDSDYHPTEEDFNKFSHDWEEDFFFDSVLGQVEKAGPVYNVSADGDDNNNGTIDKPFASLQRAINKITENKKYYDYSYTSPGWTIYIEGEITGANALGVIDSDGIQITLSGFTSGGENDILNASGQNQRVLHVGKNVDITLSDLTITGGRDDVAGGVYLDTGSVLQFGSPVVITDNYKTDGTTKNNVSYAYVGEDDSERGRIEVRAELRDGTSIGITVPEAQPEDTIVVEETSALSTKLDLTPWFSDDAGGEFSVNVYKDLVK